MQTIRFFTVAFAVSFMITLTAEATPCSTCMAAKVSGCDAKCVSAGTPTSRCSDSCVKSACPACDPENAEGNAMNQKVLDEQKAARDKEYARQNQESKQKYLDHQNSHSQKSSVPNSKWSTNKSSQNGTGRH